MLNLFRRFLRPTLREQLEDGVREALKRYAERHTAPNLRIFVSSDLVPDGLDSVLWSRDEAEHQRRFALQWAQDNDVPRAGLKVQLVILDTKREFAFVRPLGLAPEPADSLKAAPTAPNSPLSAARNAPGSAVLDVLNAPSLAGPLQVDGELELGRKADGSGTAGTWDRYMSAQHARLHTEGGVLFVTDLDSKNRTFVNGTPVPPHQPVPVQVGDEIRMGATTLRVREVS